MGMQSHVLMHPFLQVAKRKTQRGTLSGLVHWVALVPAGCTCPVLKAGGCCKTLVPPSMVSFDNRQSSLRLRFGQKPTYYTQGHLNRRNAKDEGLITNQRRTIHHHPSDDGLEIFGRHIRVENLHVH